MLSILGLITGPFIIFFLAGPWVAAAAIVMVISIVALYWRITRP